MGDGARWDGAVVGVARPRSPTSPWREEEAAAPKRGAEEASDSVSMLGPSKKGLAGGVVVLFGGGVGDLGVGGKADLGGVVDRLLVQV